jgi:hypothetical protein
MPAAFVAGGGFHGRKRGKTGRNVKKLPVDTRKNARFIEFISK